MDDWLHRCSDNGVDYDFFFFFRWPGRRELLTAMAGCVSGCLSEWVIGCLKWDFDTVAYDWTVRIDFTWLFLRYWMCLFISFLTGPSLSSLISYPGH